MRKIQTRHLYLACALAVCGLASCGSKEAVCRNAAGWCGVHCADGSQQIFSDVMCVPEADISTANPTDYFCSGPAPKAAYFCPLGMATGDAYYCSCAAPIIYMACACPN